MVPWCRHSGTKRGQNVPTLVAMHPRCIATPGNHMHCVCQIRKYQRNTDLLINRAPFCRLVHEIAQGVQSNAPDGPLRWQKDAVEALQHAAEVL